MARMGNPGRGVALLGSFVFFWIAPATVGGWVPWYFTRWRFAPPLFDGAASRWLGAALAVAGAAIVIECFARFALKGLGTPAPVAPTRHLVVSGLYRHVRNPMYVGVASAIAGQALWFGSATLLAYGAAVWAVFHLFVLLYEEPTLARQFGPEYEVYRGNVPRWLPRFTPWRGP
jgi:protein-S-isoprenylcysteine O-methyltransferase Ste14